MKGLQQEILSKYTYNKDKPIFSSNNYNVYNGTNKQSNLPVTIKTLKYPHVQLGPYLKKAKQCKSENVIKIYELVTEQQILIVVTEQVVFGNLKKALQKCKYVQEADAIFLSKQMLNGHVDLLRFDVNWFGTEEDIQFVIDGQLKLSWNNGCSFNLVNPFPVLITKISNRSSDSSTNTILPFPQSKIMEQIIRLSKQNASEISMNPQMKKKQKLAKKKGKNWVGLKQYKNKNQYFDQFGYFAIHAEHGFIRAKVFDQGKISPNLLQLNKTKTSFTKIFQVYDEGNKTIIISQYSNDGNLQSYVLRLKTAGIKLKQDQIEFFVYSLLDPLKTVQQSSLKAICMLHIRNIYIQSGIPKIGQPIPMNEKINEVLVDRCDVPDFYHQQFKRQPTNRQARFDTYSLGVLLYKLMYTQLPIFPNGKVHIPTAPTYNKRLKQSVQIFLNEGGTIREIQQRIEMSEQVKKRVQQNKQKLKVQKDESKDEFRQKANNQNQSEEQEVPVEEEQSSQSDVGQIKPEQESDQQDDGPSFCQRFSKFIALKQPKKLQDQKRYTFVDQLQLSTFKGFRIWSKCIIIFVLYTFLFFYKYIQNSVMLLASQGLLTKIDLNLNPNNASVSVISTDRYQFEKIFNQTGRTLAELKNMNCLVQDVFSKNLYTDTFKQDSPAWYGYVFGGLFCVALILVLKAIQIHTFDDINSWFRKQQGQGHFNILNWVLVNMHWLSIISGHYFLFNFVFNPQTQPCLGHKKGNVWGSTDAFFNQSGFIAPYAIVFGFQVLVYVSYLIMINKNIQMARKYNKLVNTLTVFGAILIVFWFMFRLGFILTSYYYPAAINDSSQVIPKQWNKNNYVLFFAILPQFLFLIQFICISGINLIYYYFVDKNQKLLNTDATLDASLSAIV